MQGMDDKQDDFGYVPKKQAAGIYAVVDRKVPCKGTGNTRMAFVKKESIRNQFYSDLVTPIKNGISVPGTTVHIFYAAKMGKQYLERYKKHFKAPDIRRHDLQHEELLVCYP